MSGIGQQVIGRLAPTTTRAGNTALRYATALFGQATLSVFHFALNIILVRELPLRDYGIYALAFVAAVMGASLTNALAGTPVSVYTPGLGRRAPRLFLETLLSTVNFIAVGGILLIALLATLFLQIPAATMLAFSAFVALYAGRQYARSLGYARRAPHVVLRSDILYVLASLVLILGGVELGLGLGLTLVLASLATGNLIAMAVEFSVLNEGRLQLIRNLRSLRRYARIWRQSRWALIGAITTLIAAQAHSFLVSVFSGPEAYAPLAAGFVLFGPIRIGLQAWLGVMRPELAVYVARRDRRSLRRIQRVSVMLMLLGMLCFSTLIWLFWAPISSFLYASRYQDAPMGWIVAVWCLVSVFSVLVATPSGVLQSLKAFRVLAMGTVYGAILSVAAVALLLWTKGPEQSLLGILMAEMFVAGYLFHAVEWEVKEQWPA